MWNLIGFIILHNVYKKKKFDGQMFAMYLIWYGFGRMLIEGLRTDSLYLGSVRISQLVGAVSLLLGLAIILLYTVKSRKAAAEAVEYDSIYDRLQTSEPVKTETADKSEDKEDPDENTPKES